jgi:hypothetical protein
MAFTAKQQNLAARTLTKRVFAVFKREAKNFSLLVKNDYISIIIRFPSCMPLTLLCSLLDISLKYAGGASRGII